MARKLSYEFLNSGFAPPKAVGENILVEIVEKSATKMVGKILIGADRGLESKPYFIVRGVGPGVPADLVKSGDVVEQTNPKLASWKDQNGNQFACINYKDLGVVISKLDDAPEVYVKDEVDLSGVIGAQAGDY